MGRTAGQICRGPRSIADIRLPARAALHCIRCVGRRCDIGDGWIRMNDEEEADIRQKKIKEMREEVRR